MTISTPTSIKTRSHDTWLTTKVKSKLLATDDINATRIKVLTDNGVVHLMGMVTRDEGRIAARTAQNIKDVKGIVKVFEYIP